MGVWILFRNGANLIGLFGTGDLQVRQNGQRNMVRLTFILLTGKWRFGLQRLTYSESPFIISRLIVSRLIINKDQK